MLLILLITPTPPSSPLFPYTTLFRSPSDLQRKATHTASVSDAAAWPPGAGEPSAAPASPASSRNAARIDLTRLRSEEHTSELQSHSDLVCRLLLEKKKKIKLRYEQLN